MNTAGHVNVTPVFSDATMLLDSLLSVLLREGGSPADNHIWNLCSELKEL